MAVPDPSARLLPVDPGFAIQAGSAERIVKGEDRNFSHRAHPDMIGRRKLPGVGGDPSTWQLNYDVFCVCDGHSGTAAANFVKQMLLPVLHPLMPEAVPSSFGTASGGAFACRVRNAITTTLVQLNASFLTNKILSGCTVTVAIVTGALLTVANLGDSDAILDCFNEVLKMSVPHRINDNLMERKRVKGAGAYVAAISMNMNGPAGPGEAGVGPLRIWPGGLCVSRGVGDLDVGEVVIAQPHVRQVVVPASGARLILASDGVWDCLLPKAVCKAARRKDAAAAANAICDQCLRCKQGFLIDDTTCVVVDFVPYGVDSFKMYDPLKMMANGSFPVAQSRSTTPTTQRYPSPILNKTGSSSMTSARLTHPIAEVGGAHVHLDASSEKCGPTDATLLASPGEVSLQVLETTSADSSLHNRASVSSIAGDQARAEPPPLPPQRAPKTKPSAFCACFMPATLGDDPPAVASRPSAIAAPTPADVSVADGSGRSALTTNDSSVRPERSLHGANGGSTRGSRFLRRTNSNHGLSGTELLPKVVYYADVDMAFEPEDVTTLQAPLSNGRPCQLEQLELEEVLDMEMGFEPSANGQSVTAPLWHSMPPTTSDFTTRPHRTGASGLPFTQSSSTGGLPP